MCIYVYTIYTGAAPRAIFARVELCAHTTARCKLLLETRKRKGSDDRLGLTRTTGSYLFGLGSPLFVVILAVVQLGAHTLG